MSFHITPFSEEHVEPAARLLSARHRRHRSAEPLVWERFEDEGACAREISAAWADGARGAVAVTGATVIAYLLGQAVDDARGRHVRMYLEHHACSNAGGAEALRHLYAHLASGWLRDGRFHHDAFVPVGELEPWCALGFAQEQIHALRPTAGAEPVSHPHCTLRCAGPGDIDAIEPLIGLVYAAHAGSPAFTYIAPSEYQGLRAGTLELLNDAACAYWIAEMGGEVVGYVCMRPIPGAEVSMSNPQGGVELLLAATSERVRGTGVGVALCERALAWACERGHQVCITDWKATNLSSSVFWPKRGFRPTHHRLRRSLDPRVAEADRRARGGI